MELANQIMLGGIGKHLSRIARRKIPLWMLQRVKPAATVCLCYHTLSDKSLAHFKHLYPIKDRNQFQNDVQFLKRHFDLPRYEDLFETQSAPATRGRTKAVITFDDGLAECFHEIRPILLQHKVPCIFFVTANFIDSKEMFYRNKASLAIEAIEQMSYAERSTALEELSKLAGRTLADVERFVQWIKGLILAEEDVIDRACQMCGVDPKQYLRQNQVYMTSEEIKQLAADGFTIGAHTKRHARLTDLSAAEIEDEIVESCRVVQKLTGASRVPFAFTFSDNDVDLDLLRRIQKENSFVGTLFDLDAHRNREPVVVDRVWADRPSKDPGKSTLPRLIKKHIWRTS